MLSPHPLLVPWSWKSRAIPLVPLWAVRPVQSLSAFTRVHFTLFFHFKRTHTREIIVSKTVSCLCEARVETNIHFHPFLTSPLVVGERVRLRDFCSSSGIVEYSNSSPLECYTVLTCKQLWPFWRTVVHSKHQELFARWHSVHTPQNLNLHNTKLYSFSSQTHH